MIARAAVVIAVLWSLLPAPAQAQQQTFLPKLIDALSNTVKTVKPSKGQLGLVICWNPNATVEYVQVFDAATAGAVTVGTTVPKLSLAIPPTNATGYALALSGLQFFLGIQVAATTTARGASGPGTALDCNGGFL